MSEFSDNSMDDIMISQITSVNPIKKEKNSEETTAESDVITDKQEYYEIMLVDGSEDLMNLGQKIPIKLINSSGDPEPINATAIENNLPMETITSSPNITQTSFPVTATRIVKTIRRKPETIQPMTEPVKILPKLLNGSSTPGKVVKIKKPVGRKKAEPPPVRTEPVKILPKLTNKQSLEQLLVENTSNGPARILRIVENPKPESSRSEQIDKLIEKMLKENTNEIDVFFRSMAASVKKLQPNLIPKVKMEVCNVIAKYEMQSFEHSNK